jgi:hypothetical protein
LDENNFVYELTSILFKINSLNLYKTQNENLN